MNRTVFETLFEEEVYKAQPYKLIVLNKHWDELGSEEITLLSKILSSVKLNLDSVRIITQNVVTPRELLQLNVSHAILFGSHTEPITPFYEPTSLKNIPVLQADSLDKLDDSKKKNLWLALKKMFGL